MERNILLTIQYDGTEYCGWQRQPDVPTVQEEIEKVLGILCNRTIEIQGSGRTDAGVHALGQRATFQGDFSIPTDRIAYAASNLLPRDIQVTKAEDVPSDFHARFSAVGKKYVYRMAMDKDRDPFRRNYIYFFRGKPDLKKMRKAGEYIVGTRDFKSFQGTCKKPKENTVRTVYSLDIYKDEQEIILEIVGSGFLYNMVRIIVGTLLEVGVGKMSPRDILTIMEEKDRVLAGHTAPPEGLYLAEVYYEEEKRNNGQETRLG